MPDPNNPTAHVMATPTEHGWGFITVVPNTEDPEDRALADYINQAEIPLPAPKHMLDALEAAIERFNTRVKDAAPPDPLATAPIDMPDVEALVPEYSEQEIRNMTLADRIRHYWSVIDTFTEQAVVGAEALLGPGTGAEKKSYVTQQVMGLLDKIEKRVNVIPDWIQPVVFHAFRFGVNMTIERVVRSFKARGTI